MSDKELYAQRDWLTEELAIARKEGDRGMVAYYKILLGLVDQEIERGEREDPKDA